MVPDRRPESADWHSATKSVCGTTWLRIGMLATDLLLASRAPDRSEIAAFPHPRLPPLPSETETGTNKPMRPTMRITAPITSANRRDVTPRSFARYFCVMLPVAVHLSCLIDVVGRATTWRSVVVREFGYRTDAIR